MNRNGESGGRPTQTDDEGDKDMRVAIIDDEKKERDSLTAFMKRFSQEFQKKIDVVEFESGDELMKNYKPIFDILIFDIDMPGTNGMDTARYIREKDDRSVILFVTNIAQYAINGYEVDAVDYIIKPITYYDFSMKFQKAVRRAAQRQENYIVVDTPDGARRIKIADVKYVEVLAHYLIYHMKDENIKLRGSMKEHELELGTFNFSRVHKSFLVNLAYVENIHGKEITVGGEIIPVGRVYKERVIQEYLLYIRG